MHRSPSSATACQSETKVTRPTATLFHNYSHALSTPNSCAYLLATSHWTHPDFSTTPPSPWLFSNSTSPRLCEPSLCWRTHSNYPLSSLGCDSKSIYWVLCIEIWKKCHGWLNYWHFCSQKTPHKCWVFPDSWNSSSDSNYSQSATFFPYSPAKKKPTVGWDAVLLC